MYFTIMSTHILMDAMIVCMADAKSCVSTDIVFVVTSRGMLARPLQGSGSPPTLDTSGRLGGDHNPIGGGPGRTGYGGDVGEAGTSHTRRAGSKHGGASQGESASESG